MGASGVTGVATTPPNCFDQVRTKAKEIDKKSIAPSSRNLFWLDAVTGEQQAEALALPKHGTWR